MACLTKRHGKWVIDFYDQHGKRRLRTLKEGTTKKAARTELREVEEMVERGVYIPKSRIPSFSKVAEDWLKYKKLTIRSSTLIQYEGHVNNHLEPYFGSTRISRINFDSVERFVAHLSKDGMTAPTIKKVITSLGSILRYAIRKRYVEHNPVSDIERPKDTRLKREIEVLRPEEIRLLLEKTEGQKYGMLFMLAVMSGARQGECLGLKWTDVDWFNNQIHVRRTFNMGKFFEPKSKTSRRAIDIGSTVMAELKKWKLACMPNDLDLVFPNEEGQPMNAQNMVTRHFNKSLADAKLRRVNFHTLRHTYASLLVAQGEHPKYIQKQMGHSSINVTLDIYGHLMETVNKEASKRLESAVFQDTGDKMVTFTDEAVGEKS